MELDGYIRVSRVQGRSGESFISPQVQRDQIERWAGLKGATIGTWHTDLDQSGAKDDRPGLREALGRAESGATGGIVVAKLDRFGRSLLAALEAIRRLDEAGAHFASVAEGFDLSTPTGKMTLRMMLVLAEFELDRIRETWAVAQERAVARGVHIASRAPTGYTRAEDGRLLAHPEHGPAIAEAFAMRGRGQSWREIARFLDAREVVGPYGASRWQTRAVQHVMANRAYLGEARSGRHVNADAHEPLIDRTTWEAAQAVRGVTTARSEDPALLAGLLRCAGCRYLMKPDKMTLRNGDRVRLYRCRGEHAAGTCQARASVLGRVVEPFVEREFLQAAGTLSATPSVGSAGAERALAEAEAELAAYRDDERIVGVLGRDGFLEGLQARARALDQARRELADVAVPGVPARAELEKLWPELSVAERQKLMGSVLDAVVLRRGREPIERRALVLARGEAPSDLPRRGRRVALAPFTWPVDGPDDLRPAGA